MKIILKEYQKSNFKDLEICMEYLQDFLINIDPLKRLRRLPKYGWRYTKNLINNISRQNGIIILAFDQDKIIGCIAGIIDKQSKDGRLECVPTKSGRILELFILEDYRGLDLGKKLMETIENYFKKHNCNIIRVEVFTPNENAHYFYKKLNYFDRVSDMIKILK